MLFLMADPQPQRRALLFGTALAGLWTLEVFGFQELTIMAAHPAGSIEHLGRSIARLFLDTGLIVVLLLTLPRWALGVLLGGMFLFFNLAWVYFDYFRGPLSPLTIFANFGEGMVLTPFLKDFVRWDRFGLLYVLFMAQVALLAKFERPRLDPALLQRARFTAAGFAAAGLVLGTIAQTAGPDRVGPRGFTDFAASYGYLIAGAWQASSIRDEVLLARALESAKIPVIERLTGVEAPLPVRERLVVVQVESLDWGLPGFEIDGVPVMPFVSELARRSALYKVEALHLHGSGDADFVALNAALPSPDVITYKIAEYPYDYALPKLLARRGFRSIALHGVSGDYYRRRRAFERMGFDRLIFREEMESEFGKDAGEDWAVEDEDLFEVSRRLLTESEGRIFHFLITVTSHAPFGAGVEPDEKVTSTDTPSGRFFNLMRYVDNQLQRYIESLPPGTTIVLYGDHNSAVRYPGYDPGVVGTREHVPFIIHDTSVNLALIQKTREDLAPSGQISIIDAHRFLRVRLLDTFGSQAPDGVN